MKEDRLPLTALLFWWISLSVTKPCIRRNTRTVSKEKEPILEMIQLGVGNYREETGDFVAQWSDVLWLAEEGKLAVGKP